MDRFRRSRDVTRIRISGAFCRISAIRSAPPAWSPDGKQVAFVSLQDGDDEIFVVNVDGSDLRQLTNNSDKDEMPAWSADGLQLVFSSNRDGDPEIYIMDVDGSDVRQLTDNDDNDFDPELSSIP